MGVCLEPFNNNLELSRVELIGPNVSLESESVLLAEMDEPRIGPGGRWDI